jgi:para-aminobenzoate synthetase component 1
MLPLAIELPWRAPETVFRHFARDPHLAWLDSQAGGPRARFSYLAPSPAEIFCPPGAPARAPHPKPSPPAGAPRRVITENPFTAIQDFQTAYAAAPVDAPVPFAGGLIGFLGYESGAVLENTPRHRFAGPDFAFGLYDALFAWDHAQTRLWLISNGLPETTPAARAARAERRAQALLGRLNAPPPPLPPPPALDFRAAIPRGVHEARTARIIAYIEAGDIFQANLTARFLAPRAGAHPAALHLALRAANPAPFGAYLACGDRLAIASVSPERFLTLSPAGAIEARPIKGTRPRAATPEADAALAAELQASAKDRAENLMITDLLRNDIGRVARIGSIHVPELAALESFPHIHHLVSCVRGTLRPGATAADLLRATFPGGSITGAPKIRAIEIIHELEQAPRGPYCGSLFWLGEDGAMDSSILIRTAVITPRHVTIQAGGGIVADSNPAAEYEELLTKARPLLAALSTRNKSLFASFSSEKEAVFFSEEKNKKTFIPSPAPP